MNFNYASFIIPTLMRPTLKRTLESIQAQINPNWNAIFVIDPKIQGTSLPKDHLPYEDRILPILGSAQASGSAGLLRNFGFKFTHGNWICFVDDDDWVTPNYVSSLFKYSNYDIVIFRMKDDDLGILPDLKNPRIERGHVGISYAVKRNVFNKYKFIKEDVSSKESSDWKHEDIDFLTKVINDKEFNYIIADEITYMVRDARP